MPYYLDTSFLTGLEALYTQNNISYITLSDPRSEYSQDTRLTLLRNMYAGLYSKAFPGLERMPLETLERAITHPDKDGHLYGIGVAVKDADNADTVQIAGLFINSLSPEGFAVIEYIAKDSGIKVNKPGAERDFSVSGAYLHEKILENVASMSHTYERPIQAVFAEAARPGALQDRGVKESMDPFKRLEIHASRGATIIPVDYQITQMKGERPKDYLLLMQFPNVFKPEEAYAGADGVTAFLHESLTYKGVTDPDNDELFQTMARQLQQAEKEEPPTLPDAVQESLDHVNTWKSTKPSTVINVRNTDVQATAISSPRQPSTERVQAYG